MRTIEQYLPDHPFFEGLGAPTLALVAPLAQEAARDAGLGDECRNPLQSIVVRAVELVHATDESLRIIDSWEGSAAPFVDVPARAGIGYGATEAPRGLLYHRYELAEDGTILDATIVPPPRRTSGASRRTCGCSSRTASTFPATSRSDSASRRSATTTRASHVRRTSSTSRWKSIDRARHSSSVSVTLTAATTPWAYRSLAG